MRPNPNHHIQPRSSNAFRIAGIGLMTAWLMTMSAQAALVSISNVNGNSNGGYALFDEDGSFLSDPPGKIFIGGFETLTTPAAIANAFYTNFSLLASDFDSIGSVAIESDSLGGIQGIHDSSDSYDPSSVVNRSVAIWISTAGDYTTPPTVGGEHLIYVTSSTFQVDPPPPFPEESYSVILAPDTDGGNGTLVVGEFSNYFNDFGFGDGPEGAFNTVPEPRSVLLLSLAGALGFLFYRRRPERGSEIKS